MRAFIILGFLAAAASAASLGYEYGPAGSSGSLKFVKTGSTFVQPTTTLVSGNGFVGGRSASGSTTFVSGNGLAGQTFVQPAATFHSGRSAFVGGASVQPPTSFVGSIQPRSSVQGSSILSTSGSQIKNAGTTFLSLDALDSVPQTVEYNKQVYFFSAPEEERSQGVVNKQLSNILKKNLQLVFIKAPENNAATNAAIQLAKQAIEQRTAIYVLSKEQDANQVIGQLQQIQENVQTSPEVAIIKYRTAQDLANAQANIQAQYDNFGGVVPLINGGIVPVLNYASAADLSANTINILGATNVLGSDVKFVTGSGSLTTGNVGQVVASGYLPPLDIKK